MDNTKLAASLRSLNGQFELDTLGRREPLLDQAADALEATEAELTRRDAAAEAAREQIEPLPANARMEAYYYGFERTGVGFIDAILSAVAIAGKGAHHTEAWSDEDGYGYFASRPGLPDAVSAVDLIQKAAQQAADAFLAAAPVSLEAVKAETAQPVFGDSLPNDGKYEYTTSSDCDGSNPYYRARVPARHAAAGPWFPITAEEYAAASQNWGPEWRPVSTEGDNRG